MAVKDFVQGNGAQEIAVQIVSVDPPNRHVVATLQDGGEVNILVWWVDAIFRWPVVGEIWWVCKNIDGYWELGPHQEGNQNVNLRIEDMMPGDVKIGSGSGTVTFDATTVNIGTNQVITNGTAVGGDLTGTLPNPTLSATTNSRFTQSPTVIQFSTLTFDITGLNLDTAEIYDITISARLVADSNIAGRKVTMRPNLTVTANTVASGFDGSQLRSSGTSSFSQNATDDAIGFHLATLDNLYGGNQTVIIRATLTGKAAAEKVCQAVYSMHDPASNRETYGQWVSAWNDTSTNVTSLRVDFNNNVTSVVGRAVIRAWES